MPREGKFWWWDKTRWVGRGIPNSAKRSTSKDRSPLECPIDRKRRTKMDGCNITRLNDSPLSEGTKGHRAVALVKNTQGQISIFFSASLIVLITIIAFVINIGLFVKAKINLQNATDAAAFAGAAVQARQLTTIGYLNWEMRNIYKEWMYKYYVVGNLNIKDVETPPSGPMSFNLEKSVNPIETNPELREVADPFNIPAICIHTEGSRTNICRRYAVPGLPEFGPSNLPGAEEASRAFMDALIQGKVLDCGERTALNSLVSATWAYNVLSQSDVDSTLIGRGPAVLSNRQGAWPAAVELAMRMRNLEFAANRAPITEGICFNGSAGSINCGRAIGDISGEGKLGNERAVKAFYSGYRNLGNADDSEMKLSFTLTEIPPRPAVIESIDDPSFYLSPKTYEKYYLDLKLMTINLATFYGAMIPTADPSVGAGRPGTSGECVISKVATPVPGYPLGFYKSPEVLTYYAVRGEAEFEGMFNPFGQKIKLTAYAAAKPFGGRIGPALFKQTRGFITGRENRGKFRSVPYLSSLEFVGTRVRDLTTRSFKTLGLGDYFPGVPVPVNAEGSDGRFWVEDPSKPVGGKVTDGTIQFGLPNLVYDYQTLYSNEGYSDDNERIHTINTSQSTTKPIGLYSGEQFRMFKGSRIGSENTTQTLLEEEIFRVKAPTIYEAANYLVPTPNDFNLGAGVDSFGFVPGQGTEVGNGVKQYNFFVYAPLYSDGGQVDTLWTNQSEVVSTVFDFLKLQSSGINKYRDSMNLVAQKLAATGAFLESTGAVARGSANAYREAAKQISDIANFSGSLDQPAGSCKSLVGSFLHFYYGHPNLFPGTYVPAGDGCPLTLGEQLTTYFSRGGAQGGFSPSHYKMQYNWRAENFSKSKHGPEKSFAVFTAYQPGPMTGIGPDGRFQNTITGDNGEFMRRNFYSTKFVALDSLQNGQGYDEKTTNFTIYSEGATQATPEGISQGDFKNPLNASSIGIELNAIKY
jgi:hypothetical protein